MAHSAMIKVTLELFMSREGFVCSQGVLVVYETMMIRTLSRDFLFLHHASPSGTESITLESVK